MYRPPAFRQDDLATLQAQIAETPLAILVTQGDDGLQASHLPLLFEPLQGERGTLHGHFARANSHWQALASGAQVLVIFPGAQAYVSPGYYPSKAEDHKVVPTWNYIAVHAHGQAEVYDDPQRLRSLLEALTQRHEQGRAAPWSLDQAPADYLARMLGAVVGFSLPIERLEGKWKLSQNQTSVNFAGVQQGLASSPEPDAQAVAREMNSLR